MMGWSYADTTGRATIRDGEAVCEKCGNTEPHDCTYSFENWQRRHPALCGVMGEEGDGPCHLQEGHLGLHSDGDARYGQGDDEEH